MMLMIADQGEVIAVVRRHQDITEVFRMMKARLGLTNKFIDNCGMIEGHTDKILGPSESKNWGPTTFDLFCEVFAIEFRVHIDLEAAKRMEAVWEGRERPLYPDAKVKRISKKLINLAKPHVLKDFASVGGLVRGAMLTSKHKSDIARKAAKSRWRKRRATARQARAAISSPVSTCEPGRR